jgi:hypothetical protein
MPAAGLHQATWEEEPAMAAVMIGIDPHKASHTVVAIVAFRSGQDIETLLPALRDLAEQG